MNFVKHFRETKLGQTQASSAPTYIHTRIQLYRKFMGHLSSSFCVCFDQTGQFIFTGADDYLTKVWSASDGRLLKTLRGHAGQITDMSVNYENRLLATGAMDRVIRIWDLKTCKNIACLTAHHAMITSIKFAPYNRHGTDRYLVSTSNDGSVVFWVYNVNSGEQIKRYRKFTERNRPGGQIICSSFSTGGSFLACGSSDNYIHVYGFHPDLGPYWMDELAFHTNKVDSIQFSNRGFRFISGSIDGTAAIWSFKKGRWTPLKLDMRTQLDQTINHAAGKLSVLIVQWSRDDRFVLTSMIDHSIKVWDSNTGKLVHILSEHKHDVYVLESHPHDPRIIVSAGHDGTMIIWDIVQGEPIKKFRNLVDSDGPESTILASIYDLKFSPDGNMIATVDSHGYLSLYGNGSPQPYMSLPDQMFFHTDYRPIIRDLNGFVMDEQTHVAPHLMPRPTLVDMNGNPYLPSLQRFVPDYGGDRAVIPHLTAKQNSSIADHIAHISQQEDDEYISEKNSPPSDQECKTVSSKGEGGGNSRYNTRYSFRSAKTSFKSAKTSLKSTRPRRNIRSIRYSSFQETQSTDDEAESSESSEDSSSDSSDEETETIEDDDTIIDSDVTEVYTDEETEIDSDTMDTT